MPYLARNCCHRRHGPPLGILFSDLDHFLADPGFTRIAASSGCSLTQPTEAGLPSRVVAVVPWIAESPEKKIECGIGALS